MTEVISAEVELECAVYGEGSVLPVKIAGDAKVSALQEAIFYKKRYNHQYKFDSSALTLYLARKAGEWLKDDDNVKSFLKRGRQDDGYVKLIPNWILGEDYLGANFQAGRKEILVELPEPHQTGVALERLMPAIDEGWTSRWLSEFRTSQMASHELPLVGELADFIEKELPVKITLHQRIQEHWMAKMKTASPELMAKIFRVGNLEPCVDFVSQIGNRVVQTVDPGDTETSFISFWDDLIRHVLNFVLPGIGKSDRNSSRSASTGPNRPDYLFIVDSVCVFRGEEKAPGEMMETPRRELFERLLWSYGEAPYLFGYAAVGFEVRLYAITRVRDHVDAIELGAYDLKDVGGRFRLLLAILNIARMLRSLASLCPESARDEYKQLYRDNGIKVLLEPSRVVKCFPEALFQGAKHHAQVVYKVLEEHAVPNVDRLCHADQNAKRLVFEPRGQETRPVTLAELFHALGNVLEALAKLHAASWMHRDIRWPNVVKSRDDHKSWFLIDFMDAAQSPQASPSGQHLSRAEHAPEIFSDSSHTTAVDVWCVGRLIQACGDVVYTSWYDTGRGRTEFLELLMHDDSSRRPTAVAALDRLRQLEQEYLNRQKRKGWKAQSTTERKQRRK